MMGKRVSAIGASSLLVIFAVLCLAVFALLSIATVQADQRLGDSVQQAVTAYYQADSQAEQILTKLRDGEVPVGVSQENGIYSYRCGLSDTQVLAVEVAVNGSAYEILRWQVISTADWQPEEKLPVWNGQEQGGNP